MKSEGGRVVLRLGFRSSGLGLRALGLGLMVFLVEGLWLRAYIGFRALGLGFRA